MAEGAGLLEQVVSVPAPLRMSPSRFTSAKECALRASWAAASDVPEGLPVAPAARVGTVVHKMLEVAAKGKIADPSEFSDAWESELLRVEAKMARSWLDRHLVPLEQSDRLFYVRVVQTEASALALARARSEVEEGPPGGGGGGALVGCELEVESSDATVLGYIDLATFDAGALILRDYKAGLVTESDAEGESAVKAAYQDQLKLYAALYFQSKGRWPARLEVSAPSGDIYRIGFTKEECEQLLDEARSLVVSIQETIGAAEGFADAQTALAAPAPAVCRFCSFRPFCLPYWQRAQLEASDDWPEDLWGRVASLEHGDDGTRALTLELRDAECARVREIPADAERHTALSGVEVGDALCVFGLRRRRGEEAFVTGPLTTFYRIVGSDYINAAGLS